MKMRILPFATTIAAAMLLALLWPASAWTAGPPERIVSLNLCTDELLLRLADPARIASVTWLSRNPSGSNVASPAARVPINHGLAEQVISSHPDLVIAGTFTTRIAVAMLKRTGIPVVEFGIPSSFDDVRRQIRDMSALLHEEAKGRQLIETMDARIAKVSADAPARRPSAVVLNPNGFTVGKGTLADQVMTAAGLDNVAAQLQIDSYGQIPLELVAAHSVDVLIVSESRDGPPALATEILRHPVLAKLTNTRVVTMPGRLWSCGGPAVADAVERLHVVASDVAKGRAAR